MPTREMVDRVMDELRSGCYVVEPDVLVVPSRLEKWGYYVAGMTETVWSLPGAERVRHPQFGTWIVTKWRTANVGGGGGHKWKRRVGIRVEDYWAY